MRIKNIIWSYHNQPFATFDQYFFHSWSSADYRSYYDQHLAYYLVYGRLNTIDFCHAHITFLPYSLISPYLFSRLYVILVHVYKKFNVSTEWSILWSISSTRTIKETPVIYLIMRTWMHCLYCLLYIHILCFSLGKASPNMTFRSRIHHHIVEKGMR